MNTSTIQEARTDNAPRTDEIEIAPLSKSKPKRGIGRFKTVTTFMRRGACSNTMMTLLDRKYGDPMDLEEKATDPLAGGMMRGYQCGMLWGATLAAGARAHQTLGAGPEAELAAMNAARELTGSVQGCLGSTDCMDITETDPQQKWQTFKYFFFKGGTIRCFARATRVAPAALVTINASMEQGQPEAGCNPASCAAALARRMGASDKHVTMAAGLAGGIGLSGGGCGALGAAIWILGMKGREEGLKNKVINERIEALIERFQEATDYELECSAIVGRTFDSIADHSRHVRAGGCAGLLDLLAASLADAPTEKDDDAPLASAASPRLASAA